MKTGQKLKSIRQELNVTQAEMAAKLDIARSYYSELERSVKEPGKHVLRALFDVVGVNKQWFEKGEGDILDSSKVISAPGKQPLDQPVYDPEVPQLILARHVNSQVIGKYRNELNKMIKVLDHYFELTGSFLQFIDQYDALISFREPDLLTAHLLESFSKDEVLAYYEDQYKNLDKVLSIISKQCASVEKMLIALKKYDVNETLKKSRYKEIRAMEIEGWQLRAQSKHKVAIEKLKEVERLKQIYGSIFKYYPESV